MPAPENAAAVRRRYGWLASIYDWANLETVLYADARRRAVEFLHLHPGARVLDVACGTGANFALIEERIGPSGELFGVDLTPEMLAKARSRTAREGWRNVELLQQDVTEVDSTLQGAPFDAAICTLGLSVIPEWRRAWEAMMLAVRPGARVAIMDAGVPEEHRSAAAGRVLEWPLSLLFAADCRRLPWQLLERCTVAVESEPFTMGWVTVAAGTVVAP